MATISSTAAREVPDGRLEARPVEVESWFTRSGAARKAARLRARGIPDTTNWRFTTLTIADRTIPPEDAHALGSDRMRRTMAVLRDMVGHEFKWLWKLELHEDGYPHWHLMWEHTARLTEGQLRAIGDAWGLGRCNTKRIAPRSRVPGAPLEKQSFDYVFKYAVKSAGSGDGHDGIPSWILNRKRMLRVVQTSRGFFTGQAPARSSSPSDAPVQPRQFRTLAERQDIAARRALVVRYCETTGKTVEHLLVYLPLTYAEFYQSRHLRMLDERTRWLTTRGMLLTEWEVIKYHRPLAPWDDDQVLHRRPAPVPVFLPDGTVEF